MDIFIGLGFNSSARGSVRGLVFIPLVTYLPVNLQVRRYLVMLEPSPLRSYFIRSEGYKRIYIYILATPGAPSESRKETTNSELLEKTPYTLTCPKRLRYNRQRAYASEARSQ